MIIAIAAFIGFMLCLYSIWFLDDLKFLLDLVKDKDYSHAMYVFVTLLVIVCCISFSGALLIYFILGRF